MGVCLETVLNLLTILMVSNIRIDFFTTNIGGKVSERTTQPSFFFSTKAINKYLYFIIKIEKVGEKKTTDFCQAIEEFNQTHIIC